MTEAHAELKLTTLEDVVAALRRARLASGWSQTYLARRAHLAPNTVANMERYDSPQLSIDTLLRLSAALGLAIVLRRDFEIRIPPPRQRAKVAPRARWRPVVIAALDKAGVPLHYQDLAAEVAAAGQQLGGHRGPAMTLLKSIARDERFQRVGRGTYWFADRPLPPGLGD